MFKDLERTSIPKIINFIGLSYVFIINICELANDFTVYRETWYSTDIVTISSFAIVFASYCGYCYLPAIEGSLYEPTNNRMRKVMRRSMIFLTMIYGPLSFFTYFASINPNGNWLSVSAEMILVFTLISTIPCTVVTMRNMIFDIFEYDPSAFVFFIINVVVTIVPCALAIFLDDVLVLFSLCGVLNSIMMALVPGRIYIGFLNTQWSVKKRVLGIGFGVCVVGLAVCGLVSAVEKY
ncbi:hypothetical protein SteCoe_5135 [Stentor coeruleus]|uniref:Uncharacterized protein n=1 Tax=Stentor coeruleus TaxID=5963 RepID=A0A1R2CSZ7_9CILI|nr:hypothetical protein SteCoe_5135 [Stentor coeruleus]